jgi:hypothetical protein
MSSTEEEEEDNGVRGEDIDCACESSGRQTENNTKRATGKDQY